MKSRSRYRVTDIRTGVSQEGKAEYLANLLFVDANSLRKAETRGIYLKTYWKVEMVEVIKAMDPKFKEVWDETIAMFKNVKWVKEGGRKLSIKH